jgi:aspartyl-tRNA synthetase
MTSFAGSLASNPLPVARTIVMIYEFLDVRSNAILDALESKVEAIQAIRNAVHQDGEWSVEFVMLLEDDPDKVAKSVLAIGSEFLS